MILHVITEGKSDEVILRRILQTDLEEHPKQLKIVVAGGQSSAQSLASSIAATRREPVVLILDADTTDSGRITEQRDFVEWMMKRSAISESWHVVLFRPTIEIVLFADPTILRQILGIDPDDRQQVRAEYDPKRVLGELLRSTHTSEDMFWRRLTELKYDWDALAAKLPELHSLKAFIRKHLEPVAA